MNGRFYGCVPFEMKEVKHKEVMTFMEVHIILGMNQILLGKTMIKSRLLGGTFQNLIYGIMLSLRKK